MACRVEGMIPRQGLEADARTRTADPFITSEVLYQLSYVGGGVPSVAGLRCWLRARMG